jgi:predicted MarR family transcription regulator
MTKGDLMAQEKSKTPDSKRIVSSSHLVSEKAAELSEVEYGLIVVWNAFGKWMVKAMATAVAEAGTSVSGGTDILLIIYKRCRITIVSRMTTNGQARSQ